MTITYRQYNPANEEKELSGIRDIISKDLSEPYSLYVFRYFIYRNPELCLMAYEGDALVGVIVCSLSEHRERRYRGYIAMLAVNSTHRGQGIAKHLVSMAVTSMKEQNADEIILETESDNKVAIHLYENIGFLRSKRLHHYYLNSNDAFRLILPLTERSTQLTKFLPPLNSAPEADMAVA